MPKPPIAAFLDGDQHLVLARQPQDEVDVERLGKARIGDRGRKPERAEFVGGLEAFAEPRAERQQRDFGAFAQHAALADLERNAFGRHRHAEAFAARVAQGRWPVIDRDLRRDHVDQLGLVARGHDDEARQTAEIGDVERAGVRRSVGADKAGAVHREAHRQPLDRDVVHHLVVGALQEGRIDGGERLQAFGREPAANVTPCCSAMPTSKVRLGNALPNRSMPVPDGIAAVMATILSSLLASLIRLSA